MFWFCYIGELGCVQWNALFLLEFKSVSICCVSILPMDSASLFGGFWDRFFLSLKLILNLWPSLLLPPEWWNHRQVPVKQVEKLEVRKLLSFNCDICELPHYTNSNNFSLLLWKYNPGYRSNLKIKPYKFSRKLTFCFCILNACNAAYKLNLAKVNPRLHLWFLYKFRKNIRVSWQSRPGRTILQEINLWFRYGMNFSHTSVK